ncbi:MAG: hypothetical protein JSW07_11600 [bacterium]|nr:MAG: hypothetical protein JSW07_11600 [bacterium]
MARRVKSMGGRWNKSKKVWELAYGYDQALELAKVLWIKNMKIYHCRNPSIHISNIRNLLYF